MPESLCRVCALTAARVLHSTSDGMVAVPDDAARPGHIMVVSATHAESFSSLSSAEASGFMTLIGESVRAAEQAAGAERYYVVRIGDKAPHLHVHLVPRTSGEPSLATYVFGEAGWRAQIRPDATPPAELFDAAFRRALSVADVARGPKRDAGRLPAWLVSFALAMLAFVAAAAITVAFASGAYAGAAGVGAGVLAQTLADDCMRGRPLRWMRSLPMSVLAAGWVLLLMRWLR